MEQRGRSKGSRAGRALRFAIGGSLLVSAPLVGGCPPKEPPTINEPAPEPPTIDEPPPEEPEPTINEPPPDEGADVEGAGDETTKE